MCARQRYNDGKAAPLHEAFGPFDRAWNTAHQGPLPRVAAEAARLSIEEKLDPRRIAEEAFFEVPATLRSALARLVGAEPAEIVLGNSTSYGLDLLAHGLPLQAGDEVLVVEGDFPASVYPWLALQSHGVRLRTLPARSGALEPDTLQAALTDRSRVVCTSWVFSFTGRAADVPALAEVCREHGQITFVLNGSQAVGARPIDVHALGVDALVSCGFKWLCGPYATGFAWMRPELMERLEYKQGYWLAHGFEEIEQWDQSLIQQLIDGLPPGWKLRSPTARAERSTLVFVEPDGPDTVDQSLARLNAAGVDAGQRAGKVRLSPHVHNTPADVDRALTTLAG